eukprot:131826-Hanusia_phi.AAC.1
MIGTAPPYPGGAPGPGPGLCRTQPPPRVTVTLCGGSGGPGARAWLLAAAAEPEAGHIQCKFNLKFRQLS